MEQNKLYKKLLPYFLLGSLHSVNNFTTVYVTYWRKPDDILEETF